MLGVITLNMKDNYRPYSSKWSILTVIPWIILGIALHYWEEAVLPWVMYGGLAFYAGSLAYYVIFWKGDK